MADETNRVTPEKKFSEELSLAILGKSSKFTSAAKLLEHHKYSKKTGQYELLITPISFGDSAWSYLSVEVFKDNQFLGHYVRNYSSFYDTFWPFKQEDKEYALYSCDYTSTRVMSLPDCNDLGGEERHQQGFCPTELWVPDNSIPETEDDCPEPDHIKGQFGFVAGCVWGDDSSWKIQYLDLKNVSSGIIRRDDRFGYIELLGSQKLQDAIDLQDYCTNDTWEYQGKIYDMTNTHITIACAKHFHLADLEKKIKEK
jgi:hypothetical protein